MNEWNVATRGRHALLVPALLVPALLVPALIVPLAGAVFGMRAHATETERFSREVVVGEHTIGVMLESGPETYVTHGILDRIAFVEDGAVSLSDDVISLAVVGSSTARSDDGEERLSWSEAAPLLARVLANHDNLYSVMPVREMDVIEVGDHSLLVPPALTASTRLASAGLLDKLAKSRSVRRKLYAAAALRAVALEEARRYDETLEGDLASWRSGAVTMLGVTNFAATSALDVYTELRIISGMQKAARHGASTVGIAAKVRKRVAASNLGKSVRALAVLAFAVDLAEGISESRLRQRLLAAAAADALLVSSLEDARRLLEAEDADPAMIEGLSDAIGQLTTMSRTRLERYAETGADALSGSLPSLAALVAASYLGMGGAALVVREAAELGEELGGHVREVLTVSAMATLGKTLRPRIEALMWRNAIGTTRADAYSVRELVSLHDRLGAEATASVYNMLWTDRWKDPSSVAGIARGAGLSLAEWFTADAGTEEAFKEEVAWRIGRVRKNAALSAALPQILVELQARFVGPPAVVAAAATAPQAAGSPPVDCAGWDSDDETRLQSFYRDITPEEVVACLEAGADPDARLVDAATPLHFAATFNPNPAVIAVLLDAGVDPGARSSNGITPLHGAAAFTGNPAIIYVLLSGGAEPNSGAAMLADYTPLHFAAQQSDTPAIIAALLDGGADPNARGTNRATPLHLAAERQENPSIITALVGGGANPSARGAAGLTPLHLAARRNRNPAVIAALLEAGAEARARDEDGRTPLDVARERGRPAEIIAALETAMAAASAQSGEGGTPANGASRPEASPGKETAAIIARLVGEPGPINGQDRFGRTPLHVAALWNEGPETIRALLDAGAGIGARAKGGWTALHDAAEGNQHPGVIEMLVGRGANVDERDAKKKTPLHYAASSNDNPAIIAALVAAGAEPNARGKYRRTPLHEAVERNRGPDIIGALLAGGANVNARDTFGQTPLHLASRSDDADADIIRMLLEAGGDVELRDSDGRTPLSAAASRHNPVVARALLAAGSDPNARDKEGETPLHLAGEWSDNPMVAVALMEAGADPTMRDAEGRTARQLARRRLNSIPLMVKVLGGGSYCWENSSFREYFKHLTAAETRGCLEKGADPNARDEGSYTPLHTAAARNGNAEVIEALATAGADPNAEQKGGFTPLHMAAGTNDRPGILEALVRAGARLDARNHSGATPFHVAASGSDNPAVIAAYLGVGGDPGWTDNEGQTPLHEAARWNRNDEVTATLLEGGADPNRRRKDGATPLHLAAEENTNAAIVERLLEAGSDPNVRNEDGATPLHFAAQGLWYSEEGRRDSAVIAALVEAGAEVTARDGEGRSPLHWAARKNDHKRVIATLLEADNELDPRDRNGRTPLHVAVEEDNDKAIVTLLSLGANVHAQDKGGNTPWDLAKNRNDLKGTEAFEMLGELTNRVPKKPKVDEDRLEELGDDISRYVYRETKLHKFDFVFEGCRLDVIHFERERGNSNRPFKRKGTVLMTMDIAKMDKYSVRLFEYANGGDGMAVRYADEEACLDENGGKPIDCPDMGYLSADNGIAMSVQTGRAKRVSKWMFELVEACGG